MQANSSVHPSAENVIVIASESEHETTSHNCSGTTELLYSPSSCIIPLLLFGDKSITSSESGPSSKFQYATKPSSSPVGGHMV